MEFRILGPLEVSRDGTRVEIHAPRERALLALLLLRANEVVSQDELFDSLWTGRPPPTAKAALQNAVSGLRKALGADVIETVQPGYRLSATANELDLLRFEALVDETRGAEPRLRARKLREALAEWRGAPLVEYRFAESDVVRLEELRLLTLEDRVDADLELGRHAQLVPELEGLVRKYPLRERLWAQLMVALYRAGRQAEALATYRSAHEAFVSELGIEPGPSLRNLQRAVLVQDPWLNGDGGGAGLFERAAGLLPTDDRGRATALYEYGLALWRIGERSQAETVLLEAERRATVAGDPVLAERARLQRAAHAAQAGTLGVLDYARHAEQAANLFRSAGNPSDLADALLKQGQALRDAGHADAAVSIHEEGLAAAVTAGDKFQEGFARNLLGLALTLGTTPFADVLERCERELEALEWGKPGPIGLWISLGTVHAHLGNHEAARDYFEQARASCRKVGAVSTLAGVSHFSGLAAELAGDLEAAEADYRLSFELLDSVGDLGSRSVAAGDLALTAARLERDADVERFATVARTTSQQDDPTTHVLWRRAVALVKARVGHARAAQKLFDEAIALTSETDWLVFHGETLEDAGDLTGALNAFERKGSLVAAARVRQRLDQRKV